MPPVGIIAIVIAAIVAVGVLAFGIYAMRQDRQAVIDERLGRYTTEYGSELSNLLDVESEDASMQQVTAREMYRDSVDQRLENTGFAKKWRVQLARADLHITPGEFLGMHFASALAFFFVGGFVLFSPLIGVFTGAFGCIVPRIWVSMKIGGRQRAFEDQLADNLQMWVNGLRSGYSVLQGVEAIAKEAAEPTATEFRRIVQEVQLGITLEDSLHHALERMPSDDFDLVITAVNIQREVGGNLAEILEVISHTIRERIKLKGEIRAMTAQGRVTGYIIGGMPVALLMFLMVVNPSYVKPMFTDACCGWPMLGCGAAMIAIGTAAIQKIVDIEI